MPISIGFSTMPSIFTVHGRDAQRLRRRGDDLGRAEFVEIVVVAVDLLVGDRPVERVFLVALGRIEVGGRVRQLVEIGHALGQCGAAGASASALAPPASRLRRLNARCSGVARRSGISQPRRRMMFMARVSDSAAQEVRQRPPHRQVTVAGACRRDPAPPRRAAMIWSAVRPVSSAMWSNLNDERADAGGGRAHLDDEVADLGLRHLRAHACPSRPSPRACRSRGSARAGRTGWRSSWRWRRSGTRSRPDGSAPAAPAGIAAGLRPSPMRPAVRNAMSEESTV